MLIVLVLTFFVALAGIAWFDLRVALAVWTVLTVMAGIVWLFDLRLIDEWMEEGEMSPFHSIRDGYLLMMSAAALTGILCVWITKAAPRAEDLED